MPGSAPEFESSSASTASSASHGLLVLQIFCALLVCSAAYYFVHVWRRRRAWESCLGKDILSLEELRQFDGSYGSPIYISLAGTVFDVTKGADFYRKGRSYHVYAGRESGRALGHMSLGKPIHAVHLDHALVNDMDEKQQAVLRDWIKKFREKYPVVARLVPSANDLSSCPSWMQSFMKPSHSLDKRGTSEQ